ncbi:similar to An12g10350 [Aspergillus luchuensis]|uniref:Similar to An12g10350 n=1 Tax=Aspergillus kawachii TaxID=1069201 RepID=A0A146EWZ2_ASPKA|nr:similar to An12g10350 [Aspergillus luchuensis]
MFDWFKSSNKESATQQPTWNPNTMTMQQPSAPEAPVTEQVVTGQPVRRSLLLRMLRMLLLDEIITRIDHLLYHDP